MTPSNKPTSTVPVHVGIIMDGNGRWAQNRNKPRTAGHREGLDTAKRIIKAASQLGIRYVTLYTFSTENWKRAEEEVSFLMRLIGQHLRGRRGFIRRIRSESPIWGIWRGFRNRFKKKSVMLRRIPPISMD